METYELIDHHFVCILKNFEPQSFQRCKQASFLFMVANDKTSKRGEEGGAAKGYYKQRPTKKKI